MSPNGNMVERPFQGRCLDGERSPGLWPGLIEAAFQAEDGDGRSCVNPIRNARPIRFRSAATIPAIRPGAIVWRDVWLVVEYTAERLRHSIGLRKTRRTRLASERAFAAGDFG